MFPAYGRAGTSGDRRKASISGEMSSRSEGTADAIGEEFGCGPDTDSGHAGQGRVKRVGKNPLFHLKGHFVSLLTQCDELECQA